MSGVQESSTSEDNIAESAKGRRGGPDGVLDHGACEEDGPGTWEALASLEKEPAPRRPGDHSPTRPTFAARTSNRPNPTGSAKNKRAASSQVRARDNRSRMDGGKGVGGPRTSEEGGKRMAKRSHRSKGGPCW